MTGADVDLRAFRYALAPLLQKARWARDDLQARAAQMQAGVQMLVKEQQQIERDCDEQRRYLAASVRQQLDPHRQRRALDYFLQANASIAALKERIACAQADHRELLKQCLQAQLRIDMFESDCRQQLAQYTLAQRNREAAAQDQAWIVRRLRPEVVQEGGQA